MRKEGKKVPSLFPKNAFFYTVIVHNVLTIVNNCCMRSFFSEQISVYLTNNSIIFVSLLIGIRANNFFIKSKEQQKYCCSRLSRWDYVWKKTKHVTIIWYCKYIMNYNSVKNP